MMDQGAIQVFTRVRPLDRDENCVIEYGEAQVRMKNNKQAHSFTFDRVFGETSNQEEVFNRCGKRLVEEIIKGFNCTLFAYGQTGAGKSYTIFGEQDDARGILPRILEELYLQKSIYESKEGEERLEFQCSGGMVEIYMERIYDLFEDGSEVLDLHLNDKGEVFVKGQIETTFTSADEALKAVQEACVNRHIASTQMNRESSRSHTVFTMTIQTHSIHASGTRVSRTAKLNVVDLAGYERQSLSKTSGERQKEGNHINKSLLHLGKVINSLSKSEGDSPPGHISYRDSKLTFLLRESLGGNSKTVMIANINPRTEFRQETLSTLHFATRAKLIRNCAKVNEAFDAENVNSLKNEIKMLQERIAEYEKYGVPQQPETEEDAHELRTMLNECLGITEVARYHADELENLLKIKESDCDKLQSALSAQKALFRLKTTQSSELMSKTQKVDAATLEKWKLHEKELVDKIQLENPQAIEWRSRYESLTTKNHIDSKRIAIIETLESANTKLCNETKLLLVQNEELRCQLRSPSTKVSNQEFSQDNDAQHEITKLKKDLHSKELELTVQLALVDKLKKDELKLTQEINQLNCKVRDLGKMLDVQRDQELELEIVRTSLETTQNELLQKSSKLDEVISERDELTRKCESFEKQRKERDQHDTLQQQQQVELQREIESLNQLRDAQQQTDSLRIAKLRKDLSNVESKNANTLSEYRKLQGEMETLVKEKELYQRKTAEQDLIVAQLSSQVSELEQAREKFQVEFQQEIESVNQMKDAQQQADSLRIAKLQQDLANAESKHANTMSQYRGEMAALIKDKELYQRKTTEQDSIVAQLSVQVSDLEQAREKVQEELEKQFAIQRKQLAIQASEEAKKLKRRARHSEQQIMLLLEHEKVKRIDAETKCIDLEKLVEDLQKANAKLAGNSNHKQKIRYLENLQDEIAHLRETEAKLRVKLSDVTNKHIPVPMQNSKIVNKENVIET